MLNTPFQRIREASATTGLSQYFLRAGCRDGSVPCIKSGSTYFVDVPSLIEKLRGKIEQEAKK